MSDRDDGMTFHQHAEQLLGDPRDLSAHRATAQLIVARFTDGTAHTLQTEPDLSAVYRTLVLQAGVDADPPILHTQIANHHTGGGARTLANAARELAGVLQELLDEEVGSKNLTLMLMLLRSHLPRSIPGAEITARHLAHIDQFTLSDLTLPYSCSFDPTKSFAQNRAELVQLVTHLAPSTLLERFSPAHVLTFEWIAGASLIQSAPMADVVGPLSSAGSPPQEVIAAARSYAVRHHQALPEEIVPHSLLDEPTSQLIHRVREAQDRVQRSVAPPPRRTAEAAAHRLAARPWQAASALRNATLPLRRSSRARRAAPRVALCVSGQLRGYQAAFASWKRHLLGGIDCDIFVSTWSNVGRSGAEPFRMRLPFAGAGFGAAYRETCLQLGFEETQQRYPSLFTTLADTGTTSPEQIRGFYGTDHVVVDDESAAPFDGYSNQQKMHRKIEACFSMAMESGQAYDLVIRIRPDKPVKTVAFRWADMVRACASATMFADHPMGTHYANLIIGDQFAIGSPECMEIYATTWTRYPQIARAGLYGCGPELAGHGSLAQVCWLHDINVEKVPIRFGELVEAAPMTTAAIQACLQVDTSGRMDAIDRSLLAALGRDGKPGRH